MSMPVHQEASQDVTAHGDEIAQATVAEQYARHPEFAARLDERGRRKCLQDAHQHLEYLAESLAVSQPLLFADYVTWAQAMLAGRNISVEDLKINLECLCDVLLQTLPKTLAETAVEYVRAGVDQMTHAPAAPPTFLADDGPLSPLAHEYLAALLAGERQRASRLVLDAVKSGVAVQDIYLRVFQPCQHEIGRLWQINQISVAQEHYCTAATQFIMSQLYPYLFSGERNGRTLVATCIAGDLHEIGMRMVSDLFELNGWDTHYLGANTSVASVLGAVREQHADVLAISATIIPHLRSVSELIAQVRATPDCSAVKIIVGGYPFNIVPEMWRRIGADGYARDAVTSVALANSLVSDN